MLNNSPAAAATTTTTAYDNCRNIHAGSAWDNNNLSWHCPMSPSECGSELWDAQSPLASMSLSLPPPPARLGGVGGGGGSVGGAAAAAAAVHGSNGSNGSGSHSGSAVGGGGYQQQQGEVAGVHNGHSTASNGNNNNNHRSTGSSSSGGAGSGMTGMYKCAALFPSAATSLKLGRNNLHLFRWVVAGWRVGGFVACPIKQTAVCDDMRMWCSLAVCCHSSSLLGSSCLQTD